MKQKELLVGQELVAEKDRPFIPKLMIELQRLMYMHGFVSRKLPLIVIKPNGCWEWTGRPQRGYGIVMISLKKHRAHRFVYESLIGTVKNGFCLDHLCRNRICVNPNHLEQVTPGENVLRGDGLAAKNMKKKRCKRGHFFSKENTIIGNNRGKPCRRCKKCKRQLESIRRNPGGK